MDMASRYLVVFAVLSIFNCARAETIFLQGEVGKYPIVMELWESPGEGEGRYFYDKYRQDIALRGLLEGNAYHLSSADYDGSENPADVFELVRAGDLVSGKFTSSKGKEFLVELKVITPVSIDSYGVTPGFLKELGGYEKLQLNNLKIVQGKEEIVGGKFKIRWFSETRSGLSMFHVVSGYPKSIMDSVNSIIDSKFYSGLSGYFGCSDGLGRSGVESAVRSYYLSAEFVSYAVTSGWSCVGAAHPDFGIQGTTISTRKGKELTLEDMYWVGQGRKPVPDSDAWMDYRVKVFSPSVVELFKKLYPDHMEMDDVDGCDYSDSGVWEFSSPYLTPQGLHLGAYFARVQRACDNPDWSIIPYSILNKRNPSLFGRED